MRAFSFYLVIKLIIYIFTFFACKIICVNGNANKCCCCWMKFCRGQDYKNTEKLSNRDNWLKNIEIKTKRFGGNALHGSYILSKKTRAIRM